MRSLRARRELHYQLGFRSHDYLAGHLIREAQASQIDGLEADIKAIGEAIDRARDKIRDAGPEFIFDEDKPRRRHNPP